MATNLPQLAHVYQNHHLDSTRWNRYTPRDDDIIISTSYKSGTTWMQMIVMKLLLGDREIVPVGTISPWIDMRSSPLEEVLSIVDAQQHRRFVKTHLPLDGLPYFPRAKYIVVGRDARDVFMSLWNHYRNYTPGFYRRLNEAPGRMGDPLPHCPDDVRLFWHLWMTRGWFEWESEGYPFWSNMHHVQSWWDFRYLPNILLVHFNDLLSDLGREVLRIARFLGIELPEDALPSIVNSVEFTAMKSNAEQIFPNAGSIWQGGAQTFFHKGTNGRWKAVLTAEDLELYEAAIARELSPECAAWLEQDMAGPD